MWTPAGKPQTPFCRYLYSEDELNHSPPSASFGQHTVWEFSQINRKPLNPLAVVGLDQNRRHSELSNHTRTHVCVPTHTNNLTLQQTDQSQTVKPPGGYRQQKVNSPFQRQFFCLSLALSVVLSRSLLYSQDSRFKLLNLSWKSTTSQITYKIIVVKTSKTCLSLSLSLSVFLSYSLSY